MEYSDSKTAYNKVVFDHLLCSDSEMEIDLNTRIDSEDEDNEEILDFESKLNYKKIWRIFANPSKKSAGKLIHLLDYSVSIQEIDIDYLIDSMFGYIEDLEYSDDDEYGDNKANKVGILLEMVSIIAQYGTFQDIEDYSNESVIDEGIANRKEAFKLSNWMMLIFAVSGASANNDCIEPLQRSIRGSLYLLNQMIGIDRMYYPDLKIKELLEDSDIEELWKMFLS
jgi:hypothetical protein